MTRGRGASRHPPVTERRDAVGRGSHVCGVPPAESTPSGDATVYSQCPEHAAASMPKGERHWKAEKTGFLAAIQFAAIGCQYYERLLVEDTALQTLWMPSITLTGALCTVMWIKSGLYPIRLMRSVSAPIPIHCSRSVHHRRHWITYWFFWINHLPIITFWNRENFSKQGLRAQVEVVRLLVLYDRRSNPKYSQPAKT